ncbi:hypothetical protein PbB2_00418 [Candidatus Phycosocius bacilliformis]|uniref:ATP-dependent Clp protease proteolytic subunit n=1 Tax=Candidatus Phycosocius bacilliformis TaxID=1445552 RepID=A0A2P2E6R7_9PROT|nr:hypothetical protein [Candidatus Phycosocius bacilliformis]GBF56761.1 hypothetical protein PbB2_00418 [Candidatus Phycosocius bacilliformis]
MSRPVIEYSGPITQTNIKPVLEALDRDSHYTLRIRSLGGDGSAGIALAEKVQERKIPVVIYDYCGSACALVFIASPEKRVEPNTALLFHWSMNSHADFLTSRLGKLNPEVEKARDLATRELQILERAGISNDLLKDSIKLVEPTCVSAEIENGQLNYFGRSKLGFVVFSRDALKQYGFQIKAGRNLIDTAADLDKVASKRPEWGPVGFVASRAVSDQIEYAHTIANCGADDKSTLQLLKQ